MKYKLNVNCRVWQNTPNSLIDFESDESVGQTITVDRPGDLYKNEGRLIFSKTALQTLPFLCRIVPHKDLYEVDLTDSDTNDDIDLDEVPWIVTRYVFDTPAEYGCAIHEGDLIKLGKFILRIRQIKLKKENLLKTMIENQSKLLKDDDEDNSRNIIHPKEVANAMKLRSSSCHGNNFNSIIEQDDNKLVLKNNIIKEIDKDNDDNEKEDNEIEHEDNNDDDKENAKQKEIENLKPTCRICLSGELKDNHNDPMISACKCSGTMKFLHLNCLRQMIESKIVSNVSECVTVFTFKSLECEICKTIFPERIKVNNISHIIINLHRPLSNYMIIEGMINETPDIKSIFVIDFSKSNNIKIGRASNVEMVLNDISVSRKHAEIIVKNDEVLLIDSKSKFGSLVNSSNHVSILPNKPLIIQKGRINLKFRMLPKLCTRLTCYTPKNLPYKTYNQYFTMMRQYKKQIKEAPNFLWTQTQIVDEYKSEQEQKALTEKDHKANSERIYKYK